MFYLNMTQVLVPLDKMYGIKERCSFEGSQLETKSIVFLPGRPERLGICETRAEAEEMLKEKTNMLYEREDVYDVVEYYITENNQRVVAVSPDYKIMVNKEIFSPNDVKKMVRLLNHMKLCTRLAAVVIYAKCGFLRKKTDEMGKASIYFKDERNVVFFDENDNIIHEYTCKNEREVDENE